jgi:hypothetical protein
MVITKRSTQNMEYVRGLLRHKQPGFAATLELAADLVGRELRSSEIARGPALVSSLVTSTLRQCLRRTAPAPSPALELAPIRVNGISPWGDRH